MTDTERPFYVRLAATMKGKDAGDAVQALVDSFTDKGLRDWLYRVDDPETGQMIGYFNGWGEQIDTTLVEQAAEAIRASKPTVEPEPEPEPEPDAEPEEESSDDELEQYADSLNGNGAAHA